MKLSIPGLTLTPADSDYGVSKFDITLVAEENAGNIELSFVYATDLFKKETIARFGNCFRKIINAVAKAPEKPLALIDIIAESERQQILYWFNETETAPSGSDTVVSLFEAQVKLHADKTALVMGRQRISYRQLNRMANGIAHRINAQLPAGDHKVALLFRSSIEMIAAILGVLKAGCAYVPLSMQSPPDRNRYIMSDCHAITLLTTREFAEEYEGWHPMLGEEHILFIDKHDEIGQNSLQNPAHALSLESSCNVIYTSGTTGQPKGVEVKHGGLVNFASWRKDHYKLSEQDNVLQLFSYFFDGYSANLFPALVSGATLVLLTEQERLQADTVVNCIRQEAVSSMVLTPTLFNMILNELEETQESLSVRQVTLAGEKFSPELYARIEKTLPDTEVSNEYGLSETSVGATFFTVRSGGTGSNNADGPYPATIPIGKPIRNYSVYILNEQGQLQPVGVAGELCIGGQGIAKGYVNNEELNKEKFVADPFREGGRMFRTGDLARWLPDGNIDFIGRRDNQVKLRGFRIETGEIESQLAKYTSIEQAIVVAATNDTDKYLLAYYVAKEEIAIADLRNFLGKTLPDYMVPACYVHLQQLPLSPNGKLDLKLLPPYQPATTDYSAAVTNDIEDRLIDIWAKVLKIGRNRISVDSNFFELGGHSINIVKMNSIINETFGCQISVANMFRLPTIRSIEAFINHGDQAFGQIAASLDQSATEADENMRLLTENI